MSADGVRVAKGYVEIGANLDPLTAKLQAAQNKLLKVGQKIRSTGLGMFTIGAGAMGALVPSIMQASGAIDGFNKFQALMGEATESADARLAEISKRVRRYQGDLRDTASSFQGLFRGLGVSQVEASKLSTRLTELSIDFASFNGMADQEAAERFLAGLSGSGEVFDRFGIDIKESALKAQLAKMGIVKDATELQKVMARIAIIEESMKRQASTGDATKTRDDFSNQLKGLAASAKEASEKIGTALIPVIQQYIPEVQKLIGEWTEWLQKNPELVVQLAKVAGSFVALGVPLMAVGKGMELASGGIGVLRGGFELLRPLIRPKDMLEWVNATEKATATAKMFFGALVVAALAKITYEFSGMSAAVDQLNRELERSAVLSGKMERIEADRRLQDSRKTVPELKAMLAQAEQDAASLPQQIAKREKDLEALNRGMWVPQALGGTNPGELANAKRELEELTRSYDQVADRLRDLRKQLKDRVEGDGVGKSIQQAAQKEADVVTKAAEAMQAGYEATQRSIEGVIQAAEQFGKSQAKAWEGRLQQYREEREQARARLAAGQGSKVQISGRMPEEDEFAQRFARKKLPGGSFDRWMSSLLSVGFGATAKGLAARTVQARELREEERELLEQVAKNTAETKEVIKNMPPWTLG